MKQFPLWITLLVFPALLTAQSDPTVKRFFRTKPAPVVDSGFGSAVTTNGSLVITGDPNFSVIVGATTIAQRGIVHVFNATTGAHLRVIEPPLADRSISELQFGKAVAVFGDVLAVSSITRQATSVSDTRGVYLFRASTGTLITRIPGTAIGFGAALAIHGDILIIGSPEEETERGAVYLHSISTGALLARLTASDRAEGDVFGTAVAISPYYLLIGAPGDNTSRGTNAGSGYLFENLPPFKQVRKLTDEGLSPDHPTNANAQLGSSVAIRSQQLFLGAPSGDVPSDPDCGFVLEFIANRPSDLRQILPINPPEITGFGSGLSASDDLLAIGPATNPNGFPSTIIFSLHNWENPEVAASLVPIGIQPADQLGIATAVHGSTVYALTGSSPTPSQRGALFQLTPVSRPPLPGIATFKQGTIAPGVPGATIASSLVQLQDPTTGTGHQFLSLTGPGAAAVKARGIWADDEPSSPSLFPGQPLNPSGTITSLSSLRVSSGLIIAQGKIAGSGINSSNDDIILAKIPNQSPFAAFREGDLIPDFGSFTFVSIQSLNAHAVSQTGEVSLIGKLRTSGFGAANAGNDSFLATNNVKSPLPNASRRVREGDTSALNLGQFLPRVASGGSAHSFVTAIPGSTDQNQAALLFDTSGPTIIAQKGNTARLTASNAFFSSFLGESISNSNTIILRSVLTGSDINRSSNEALHLAGRSFSPNPIARKGDIAPGFAPASDIRIAAFLSFQNTTQGGSVLFLARLSGPGVTAANDLALFVSVTPTNVAIPPGNPIRPSHLLLREGDLLPTSSKATIQTIHRVAYSEDGDYMALVSLVTRSGEATAADNLALLYGESRFTFTFPTDAEGFRKPFLLLRKGAHLAEYGGRPVKSLSFFPGTVTPSGASGTGIGNVAGNGVPEWTLDLGPSLRAAHHGGFNN
jgi:hypothetical protein